MVLRGDRKVSSDLCFAMKGHWLMITGFCAEWWLRITLSASWSGDTIDKLRLQFRLPSVALYTRFSNLVQSHPCILISRPDSKCDTIVRSLHRSRTATVAFPVHFAPTGAPVSKLKKTTLEPIHATSHTIDSLEYINPVRLIMKQGSKL